MKIQILGSGCSKCKLLEQHAREAVAELKLEAEVEKVTDIDKIVELGVMAGTRKVRDEIEKAVVELVGRATEG